MKRFAIVSSAIAVCFATVVAQNSWPDLTKMWDSGYKDDSCTIYGAAQPGTDKAYSNAKKNRFRLPGSYKNLAWKDFVTLPSGNKLSKSEQNSLEDQGVQIEGYVYKAFSGGSGGESCNCGATKGRLLDTHIELVQSKSDLQGSSNRIVVESTSRTRLLAKMGLLNANFSNPTNWSHDNLSRELVGKRVRLKGWLFYDPDHESGAWSVDKKNRYGESNWRATPWEVHPVMSIEVIN